MKIIAGMHRSGTSLVARLFFEAGADLGDPDQFYRPDRWNPDGYFEQPDIHAVNMPLINGPFWKLAYFFLPREETIRRRARARSSEIRLLSEKYRGKIVKENRFCLTLTGWLDQGAEIDRILFVLREPAMVVRSLGRRNWITVSRGQSLWLIHNKRLLETAEKFQIPFHFIRYGDLLSPDYQVRELSASFDFMGLEASSEKNKNLLASIVKPPSTPSTFREARVSYDYPPSVSKMWRLLCDKHNAQFAPSPSECSQR